ncbi:MAG: HD domain-containing protein [Clostridia bacterium]
MTFEEYVKQYPDYIQDIVEKMKSISERKDFHPEDTLYDHTRIVWERAKTTEDPNYMCAALLHDIGKVEAYEKYGKSYGHDKLSCYKLKPLRQLIVGTFGCKYNCVYAIIEQHMRISKINEMRKTKQEELFNNPYYEYINRFKNMDNMLYILKENEKW